MSTSQRLLHRRPPALALMIIPLIDVIFLLLLFFVMTTSFEVTTRVRIELPSPENSQAQDEDPLKSVLIHCEYAEGGPGQRGQVLYRFGTDPPEPLERISARLDAALAVQRERRVTIRADRRAVFGDVRRVMELLAQHGIPLINVSILRNP